MLVATGRMFRSVRRYLDDVGLHEPVVCYQGAAVVDPRTGEFLLHEPLDLDVAAENEYTRRYSGFQRLPVTQVGDLLAWLERPPTKLVAVAEPPVLAEVRAVLAPRLEGRAFLTTSLPYMLELGNPGATKGSGLAFVAARLGLHLERVVAFGDGENDVELLEVAGFGVAVENAHPRLQAVADRTCPGPADEGVAGVIEAVLDSLA